MTDAYFEFVAGKEKQFRRLVECQDALDRIREIKPMAADLEVASQGYQVIQRELEDDLGSKDGKLPILDKGQCVDLCKNLTALNELVEALETRTILDQGLKEEIRKRIDDWLSTLSIDGVEAAIQQARDFDPRIIESNERITRERKEKTAKLIKILVILVPIVIFVIICIANPEVLGYTIAIILIGLVIWVLAKRAKSNGKK